ncbi:MAG: tRNA 5-methoxyuridine(34)/uridine 5-oxyacetic acid(34) synthase CmoB [Pseudomonadota bacterium]
MGNYDAADIERRLRELPRQDLFTTMRRRVLEHGDAPRWQAALAALPTVTGVRTRLDAGVAAHGLPSETARRRLRASLSELHPWRKGPFDLHGVFIDTEWRSNWKWSRIEALEPPLRDARVLDVGCGNGYYGWRMLAAGARAVTGIDPTALFYYQHLAVSHALGHAETPVANVVLPLRLEELTPQNPFDVAFSMGVIYHRREPRDHLRELAAHLRPGGSLVLETLVAPADLFPTRHADKRYARMRNVHVVPSVNTVLDWLNDCGFVGARASGVIPTSVEEQRTTEWMRFESLAQCLNRDDASLTVEGHPAPARACFVAELPQ